MDYKIIRRDDYNLNRQLYIDQIRELFKNDKSKIANLDEITNHLDFLFNDNLNSFLIFQINQGILVAMINGYEYDYKTWCLFSIFIKKEYRNKGFALNLLKFTINELKKEKFERIIVGIEKENISSIKLHEKAGFKYANCNWDDFAHGFPENHLGYIYKNNI